VSREPWLFRGLHRRQIDFCADVVYDNGMRSKIEKILGSIRPALQMDGGDIELVRIDKKTNTVYIRFIGSCEGCSISEVTLRHLVEKEIKKALPQISSIVPV